MRVTSEMRALVEMQGYVGLSDDTIRDIYYWLRLAPLLCGAWALAGTLGESAVILAALVPIAVLGAALPQHPFDVFYTFGVRPWRCTPPLPKARAPRRFACAVGACWLAAAAASFSFGLVVVGRVLGGTFTLATAVLVVTGFCIPSYVYRMFRQT